MTIQNKIVVILGAGESGVGAAILAQKLGATVFVSDFGKIATDYKAELIQFGLEVVPATLEQCFVPQFFAAHLNFVLAE